MNLLQSLISAFGAGGLFCETWIDSITRKWIKNYQKRAHYYSIIPSNTSRKRMFLMKRNSWKKRSCEEKIEWYAEVTDRVGQRGWCFNIAHILPSRNFRFLLSLRFSVSISTLTGTTRQQFFLCVIFRRSLKNTRHPSFTFTSSLQEEWK